MCHFILIIYILFSLNHKSFMSGTETQTGHNLTLPVWQEEVHTYYIWSIICLILFILVCEDYRKSDFRTVFCLQNLDVDVEDNIRMDPREVGWEGVDWTHLA
jgi:hypothetical protein